MLQRAADNQPEPGVVGAVVAQVKQAASQLLAPGAPIDNERDAHKAMRAQQDYKKVSEAYHKSGLIYELRDRILADKALEMVYSKAKINEVPAVSLSEPKNAD